MSYLSMSDLTKGKDLKMDWEMDDGYAGGRRPQHTTIDWSDIDELLWECIDMCECPDEDGWDDEMEIDPADLPDDFNEEYFMRALDEMIDENIYEDFKNLSYTNVKVGR